LGWLVDFSTRFHSPSNSYANVNNYFEVQQGFRRTVSLEINCWKGCHATHRAWF
jgi:hypothetical protein